MFKTPILQMKNIHVNYGIHHALNGVNFDLYAGEIHGLVGEHRAGKSTLVKLLTGAVKRDAGQILFNGKPVANLTPKIAGQHKIGIMYQSSHIIPTLNAVENIFVGRDLTKWGIGLNNKQMQQKAQAIFERLGIAMELHIPLKFLSEAKQHLVELAKALVNDPEILIFDEISSRLTPEEMEHIYSLLLDFKRQGRSIIYISHNMDEIFDLVDRVTILKDGYHRGTEEVKDLDKVKLMKLTYSFVLSREELESDNRELYLLKKYNENIIKNLPEGVIILDPNQQIYLINYAATTILEVEETEALQHNINVLLRHGLTAHQEAILSAISSCAEQRLGDIAFKDGKILDVQIFPFQDEDYKFLGTILIVQDVTRERQFHEYLVRAEKIASIAELAAGVAHEINNPLGIIQNYVMLLKRKSLDQDGQEKLNKVESELRRIVGIVDSLLSFSRLKKIPMHPLDLGLLVADTLMLLNHKCREKGLTIRWQPPTEEILVMGDENKLKQVFINLLMNSIEAVGYQGEISVTLTVNPQENAVDAAITDNGYGIPPDVLPHIFDPFFTTKVNKKNSGLGLAICQHIIESHQGLISCATGDTTTFTVHLPLVEQASSSQ